MDLKQLINLLQTLNLPIAYHQFKEAVEPPFLIYIDTDNDDVYADDINYHEVTNLDIELYSVNVDRNLEESIKQLLKDNEIPFDWTRNYIESENIYQTIYEVVLI